ncbi:gamma-glutamyltransferase family protein [Roseinatronobacter sp. S2]|uniref:gamma-glutamyltransferase family protein n=1 Tax=Roseinatronobacter sp. S2 TaxID=3035471 RepID=UPI0024104278|nr:gamma-glutamyltransferase family protein [Roseinatronobacter sp. S2]WFE74635.1 gamma-glutamyltransferase family protein [Roseinatronobacter sp. S2]
MSSFTTRPEITGTFGVVTSTHWIASSVGMAMLERGGNAFDAAVAAGLVLQVVEPHLNGPAGELPAILWSAQAQRTDVISAQGPAPAGATIAHYRAQGLRHVPGDGLLATVIPGAWDGWMLMLRDYGRLSLRDVLEPAIHYCSAGHPCLPRVANTLAGLAAFFRDNWPSSYETWVPGGQVPVAGQLLRNPALARTYTRILAQAESHQSRNAQIEAARNAFYRGFVAEEMDAWLAKQELPDSEGRMQRAVLTAADMAGYSAQIETPVWGRYGDWDIAKCGAWTQGPVLLQSLALLDGMDLRDLDPHGADFIHLVTEAMKLAFADREVYLADPNFTDVPLQGLLSAEYNAARRALIGGQASLDLNPGTVPGFAAQRSAMLAALERLSRTDGAVYEPTMAHLARKRGDTVHLDVIDAEGNMVAATPSGGWLQSSPAIPSLGFCLNSRAQMFWLEDGLPGSLAPGKRPRTTLSPTFAMHNGRPRMVFGTPGGDQQDQWQLIFFLYHAEFGMGLQQALDAPLFHSTHFPASFYPRSRSPGQIMVEDTFGPQVIADLRARGHDVQTAPHMSIGRLTAAAQGADGILRAGASPRLMQAYAVGR